MNAHWSSFQQNIDQNEGKYEVEIQQFDIFQRKDFNFFLYVVGNILQFPYFWTACHSRNVSVWKVF